MVFVRYVLNQNTIWQTDFITYCLVAATFIGSPYVLMTRGHVNVDVLPHYSGRACAIGLAVSASVVTLAFAIALFVLTSLFWKEAWDNHWVSDTMWRARLWIPYASMPMGLGLLVLQAIAELIALLRGTRAAVRHDGGHAAMSPTTQGLLVLVVTLVMLLSGAPVAFGLGAISIVFIAIFQGFDALHVVAETFYAGLNDFTLVSIPMFVMMGAAIGSSPAGKDLYIALDRWLYRLPGGPRDVQPRRLRDLRRAHRLVARLLRGDRQDGHPRDAEPRLSGRRRHGIDLRRRHARHPHPALDHLHPLRHRDRDLHRAALPRRRACRGCCSPASSCCGRSSSSGSAASAPTRWTSATRGRRNSSPSRRSPRSSPSSWA